MEHSEVGEAYPDWVRRYDTLSDEDRRLIRAHVGLLPRRPTISLVASSLDAPDELLLEAIASVRAQLYPFWELWVAGAPSPSPGVASAVDDIAGRDPRLRRLRGGAGGRVPVDVNDVLARAAGEFVALVDPRDVLAEHALYEVAVELGANPDADVVYSDEDRVDAAGRRSAPRFKPMWSPELLAGHDLVGRLGVYRRALLERIGGLRPGYEGGQEWDLALRATAATTPDRIRHIPAVLYHRRLEADPPPRAGAQDERDERGQDAGRRAVADWLKREGVLGARVDVSDRTAGWTRVTYPIPHPPPVVTVIVPTRDRPKLLAAACDGVLLGTDWPTDRLELLVVDNGSSDPDALALMRAIEDDPRCRVLRVPGPFNYPRLNNVAALEARGSVLVLLNNDIEVVEPGWLREMVGLVLRPGVGAVGAKLLYPNGQVQHGGVVMGPDAAVQHLLRHAASEDPGFLGQLALVRALSAVTGACLVLRREVFDEAGGLDEALAVSYNDIDLCLRLQDLGYRVLWTPNAVLMHRESATRGLGFDAIEGSRFSAELDFMRRRWGRVLDDDPHHNPNLLLHAGPAAVLAAPPRRVPPWRRGLPR